MKAIATKSLGVNAKTGLEDQVSVWSIYIDSEEEKIHVGYKIETLSPKGSILLSSPKQYYIRLNKPEQREPDNTFIAEANMKFDELRNSEIGKAIEQLIVSDLEEYPEF